MKKMIIAILAFSVAVLHAQTQSLSFNRSAKTNISISSSDFGSYSPTTLSFGATFKRTGYGVHSFFWAKSNGSFTMNPVPHWSFYGDINPSDHPTLTIFGGPQGQTQIGFIEGNVNLRNQNVHTYQADVETTNPVASERLRLYIDGVRVTSFVYAQYPTLNAQIYVGSDPVSIGGNNPPSQITPDYHFQGYQENCWFVSGRNPPQTETITETSANVISFIRGDSTPISLDAHSGKTWNNQGVIYGPPL